MKVYKEIKQDNGTITFYGGNRWIKTAYGRPDWIGKDDDDLEEYFMYRGRKYYLSEFMRIDRYAPEYMKEFDGYTNDSFFSGVVVKIGEHPDGDTGIKAFLFIS